MLNLESKYFNEYYGSNPRFYNVGFLHYNVELFDEDFTLLEKDLVKVKEYIKDLFKLYFSNVEVFMTLRKYTNIISAYFNDVYVRINDVKDFNTLHDVVGIKIIIPFKALKNYDKEILNKYNIVLQVDNVSELSVEELNTLSDYNISEIICGQICYLSSYFTPFFERIGESYGIDPMDQLSVEKQALISNDNYSKEEYITIYNALYELVKGIDSNLPEVEKFKIVYERIIHKVTYDFDGVTSVRLSNQNLVGGLLNNSCVCEGYSKVLQQALSLVGIDSVVVGGNGEMEDGGHIWNQVKIDGVWYNADAAYDSIRVHNGEDISLCLVDDSKVYKTDYLIANKCDKGYDFNFKR